MVNQKNIINNRRESAINNDSSPVLKKAENSAIEIANYLLSLDPTRKYFTKNIVNFGEEQGVPLIEGNFRLNKMLHMCQIFYCIKHKKPLFKELMMAFKHGAVVHKVYANFYKLYETIQKPIIHLTTNEQIFTEKVFNYFKKSDDLQLRHFSHQDPA
jgi:hypothetical protein